MWNALGVGDSPRGRRISRGQGGHTHEEANALRSCRKLAVSKAKRQRDRFGGFKAIVELAAKLLRVVWGSGGAGPRKTACARAASGGIAERNVP